MTATVTELGPCKRRLDIELSVEQVKEAVEKGFRELRQTVQLPGFRKGKAPREILEKRFGKHVIAEVRQDLVVRGIDEGMREHELEPVSEPHFEGELPPIVPGQNYSFSVTVEVRADFELPSLDGLTATRRRRPVGDADVQGVLQRLARDHASWSPVDDGAAAAEDLVIGRLRLLDESGTEVFKRDDAHSHVGHDAELIGIPVEGLREGLVGLAIGGVFEAAVEVPAKYPVADLREKHLKLIFTLDEIKRLDLPTIDDEFAGRMGFDNLAELTERIRHDIEHRIEEEAQHDVEEQILDTLVGRLEFPLPESTVVRATAATVREMLMARLMAGQLAEDREAIDKARLELEGEARKKAETSIRAWYLMQKIAKKERIFCTEEDVEREIVHMAMHRGMTPTKIREEIAEKDNEGEVRARILEGKVRKWLTGRAQITEEKVDGGSTPSAAATEGGD